MKNRLKPIFHCEAKYLASGVAVGNAPKARILRWIYQHVGIFWRYLTLKCVLSPTPNPNASQCNIVCVGFSVLGLAVAMYISHFFVSVG